MQLDDATSYASLVGVPSSQDATIELVNPFDPDNSYLIQKLEGTAGTGVQMPINGTPLIQPNIDVIRQWIIDGAIDDRVVVLDPVRVTSLSPAPNADLTAAPARITAGFDRDLNASTVSSLTFLVEGSGGDGTFGDGNDVSITAASVSVPAANPRSAVFDLTGVALADDTYRVRLLGSGASMIQDNDANALDGEFLGVFPSGDGSAGGNFIAQFSITKTSRKWQKN